MPQSTLEKLGVFLGFFLLLMHFAGWISSGYLAWGWVHPESFGGGLAFIFVWGITGTIIQYLIPFIIVPILMGIDSFFAKPQPSKNHYVNLPQTVSQKPKDKDYTGWVIAGFIGLCGVAYFYEQSDNKYRSAYQNSYTTNPTATNYYPNSQQATAQCYDGTYCYSTGRQGICSHHGGVQYWFTDDTSPNVAIPSPTITPTQIATQISPIEPMPTQTPNPIVETTASTSVDYAQAKSEFDNQIVNLNQAWQKLQPSFRKSILLEQRDFNQKREIECKQFSLTVNGYTIQQETANLQCQISRLKERTQFLQSQVYITVMPPQPTQEETQAENEEIEPNSQHPVEQVGIPINPNKKSYDIAIVELNRTWNQLMPEVRAELRPEQKEHNQYREAECREYALSSEKNEEQQQSIRLACEIQLIEERTKYLKQKIVPKTLNVKIVG